jgi:hypothetical protein
MGALVGRSGRLGRLMTMQDAAELIPGYSNGVFLVLVE